MENLITNCGLIALRSISDMKDISVRTLINIAEDNGFNLHAYYLPYHLTAKELNDIKLPAIIHKDNHFQYVEDRSVIPKYIGRDSIIILTEKSLFHPVSFPAKIKGATWVAAGVAGATLTAKLVSNAKRKRDLKKRQNALTESTYIPPSLNQALGNASQDANATRYAGQDTDEANIRDASNSAIANVQRGATSSANVLNAAGGIQSNQNAQMRTVGANLQRFRMTNKNNFNSLLLQKANQQRQNKNQYNAAKSALQAGIDKSEENMWNAVGEAGETFLTGYTGELPAAGKGDMSDKQIDRETKRQIRKNKKNNGGYNPFDYSGANNIS